MATNTHGVCPLEVLSMGWSGLSTVYACKGGERELVPGNYLLMCHIIDWCQSKMETSPPRPRYASSAQGQDILSRLPSPDVPPASTSSISKRFDI